ncbi:MAG: ribosome-associated translation inhibitor RaiA [Tepidisphaeraceae bacterium]
MDEILLYNGSQLTEVRLIVTISSRHMEVTAALKAYAEQKTAKLTRYYDRIQEIEVVFDNARESMRVEMIVNAEHRNMFIAHHAAEDAYACVDGCSAKLERQLSEHKKKFRNRKHSGGNDKHAMRTPAALGSIAAARPRKSRNKRQ